MVWNELRSGGIEIFRQDFRENRNDNPVKHMAHHHIMRRSGNFKPGSSLKMSAKSATIEELAYVDFV